MVSSECNCVLGGVAMSKFAFKESGSRSAFLEIEWEELIRSFLNFHIKKQYGDVL